MRSSCPASVATCVNGDRMMYGRRHHLDGFRPGGLASPCPRLSACVRSRVRGGGALVTTPQRSGSSELLRRYVRSGMRGDYHRMCPVRAPVPANAALRLVALYNFILLTQSWLPGRISRTCHMRYFIEVDREIKKCTKHLLGGLQLISGAIKMAAPWDSVWHRPALP